MPDQVSRRPVRMIRIRLVAKAEILDVLSDQVVRVLEENLGWLKVYKSRQFRFRPPYENEARVYIEFLPPEYRN